MKSHQKVLRSYMPALAMAISLTACLNSDTDPIVSDYEVAWTEKSSLRSLFKGERIVPPYVFAAGHNEKYIVLKQHPLNERKHINKDTTHYYVVEITNGPTQDKPVYGPFDQRGFDSIAVLLQLQQVEFEHEYPFGWHWKMR